MTVPAAAIRVCEDRSTCVDDEFDRQCPASPLDSSHTAGSMQSGIEFPSFLELCSHIKKIRNK
ncbi:hypothetical protein E2C01_030195 [Portunus trituberculatus]|uniref:Uncharacterized protein n=1 Tax=Portunus trituberculatus TaxID=210409 RepID=A0A5B7EU35_PORTR|nr:hypothetical protein [Portunus trituberculatus]